MFPAAFLALLAPQLRPPGAPVGGRRGRRDRPALVPVAPAGVPVVAAVAGLAPAVLAREAAGAVSWSALLVLCGASYALKLGAVDRRGRQLRPPARASSTSRRPAARGADRRPDPRATGRELVLDARVPALGVAAVLVWRRALFLVVPGRGRDGRAAARALAAGRAEAVLAAVVAGRRELFDDATGVMNGTSRSWAMRSPAVASKRASPRLTSTTRSSPR